MDNALGTPADDASVVALLTDLKVYARTPSESVLSREWVGILARGLEQLAAEYREALHLRYLDDLPIADVARRMARSEGAVHMLCQRALRAMRAELSRLTGG